MPDKPNATARAFRRRFSDAFDAGEKAFPHHYLLYASSGCFYLELAGRNWLLPTHRAALIRSGEQVRIWTQGRVTSASVLFTPSAELAFDFDCRVFCVSELMRGMLDHCMRWDTEQAASDPAATRMFGALADVCLELSGQADQFWLPRATSKALQRAMQFTLQHLGGPLLGVFNAAFRAFTGNTPSGYRRRLRAGLSSGTLANQ